MSRSRQQRITKYDGLILYIEKEIERTKTYHRKNVKHIHASAMILADRLAYSGDIQNALDFVTKNNNIVDNDKKRIEESSKFLEQQRSNLKNICERNEKSLSNTDAFIWALTAILDDFRKKQSNDNKLVMSCDGRSPQIGKDKNNNDNDFVSSNVDVDLKEGLDKYYEKEIRSKMNKYLQTLTKTDVVTKSNMFLKCIERLGETLNEDEGLQIVNPSGGITHSDLKCPITGRLFVKPVKNTVCGHAYDLDGLRQYMKNKKRGKKSCNCPIVGCRNSQVTLEQVEEDVEIEMKVKRYKLRMERENRHIACPKYNSCQETVID